MNPTMTEDQEHDDNVRTQLMCALLRTVPPNANSAGVANFVWDTVERLMQFRATRQGLIPVPPDEKPKGNIAKAEPAPVKTPFPTIDPAALPTPPAPPSAPYGGANATWGSGAKFGDGTKTETETETDGEHDDGPY